MINKTNENPQHGEKKQLCQQNLWRKIILINKNDFLYQIIIISFIYTYLSSNTNDIHRKSLIK